MDLRELIGVGARALAKWGKQHTQVHAAAGFSAAEWKPLTQQTPWTAEERKRVRSCLAELVNVSLTMAGLPAMPMPSQYVAMLICEVVAEPNRYVAATRAPESFDAYDASGLAGPAVMRVVETWQMLALVTAYSSGTYLEGPAPALETEEMNELHKKLDDA